MTDPTFTHEELVSLTGFVQPSRQLAELHKRGFSRAYRNRLGRVILERAQEGPALDGEADGDVHQASAAAKGEGYEIAKKVLDVRRNNGYYSVIATRKPEQTKWQPNKSTSTTRASATSGGGPMPPAWRA